MDHVVLSDKLAMRPARDGEIADFAKRSPGHHKIVEEMQKAQAKNPNTELGILVVDRGEKGEGVIPVLCEDGIPLIPSDHEGTLMAVPVEALYGDTARFMDFMDRELADPEQMVANRLIANALGVPVEVIAGLEPTPEDIGTDYEGVVMDGIDELLAKIRPVVREYLDTRPNTGAMEYYAALSALNLTFSEVANDMMKGKKFPNGAPQGEMALVLFEKVAFATIAAMYNDPERKKSKT